MASYTTGVELHVGEDEEDLSEVYEILHEEMEDEGFTRTIKYDDDNL